MEKEFLLFKSSITQNLYDEFLDSFNLKKREMPSGPFVFVDLETSDVRLIANSYQDDSDGFTAISVAGPGELEYILANGEEF